VSGAVIQDTNEQFDSSDLESPAVATFIAREEPDFASLFFLAVIFFVWLICVKASRASTAVFTP
jgi:hypothetical protein